MKVIIKILIVLLAIVIFICATIVGGYIFVLKKYNIDLIKTVEELKVLNQSVTEEDLVTNPFTDSDMVDLQTEVNKSVENFIIYTEEHGYSVNFDDLPSEMKYIISLTDRQIGSLAQTIIKQELNGQIEISGKNLGLELKQVDFGFNEQNQVVLNSVLVIDLSSLKNTIPNNFIFNFLKSKIPSLLYISSTVIATREVTAFSYGVEHISLTINNLSAEQTNDLFNTLNKVLKIGTCQNFNLKIGKTLLDAMVGNESENGLAYSLKELGATDYEFSTIGGIDYFSVLR